MKDRGSFEWGPVPKLGGRPCPFVVLEDPLAKRIAGLSLIREDLQAVRQIFYRMHTNSIEDVAENKVLFFGVVTLYGKCFTQAKGRGVKLNAKDVFSDADSKESHERIMQMRHEFVAHAGEAAEEHLKILLLLDPDRDNKKLRGIVGQGVSAHGLDEQACKGCVMTVDQVLKYVKDSLAKACAALEKSVRERGTEWAYENAIWPADT